MEHQAAKLIGFGLILFLAGSCAMAPRPLLAPSDEAFFHEQARRIVDSAALAPGQSSGPWRNTTSFKMHVPGGNMGYPAYWVRDSVMMLGGDFITSAELEGWIRMICRTLVGPGDRQVRPGVVVPAYAVPDHINLDGTPTFYPGYYESEDKQGGAPWGKYPPLDDHFYFVAAVYEHWRMTGSTRLFDSMVKTSFNEMKLSALCEKVFVVAPVDPETGLVVAGDIETENAKDWGFCDNEFKSGRLLFPSLLKYEAAIELAAMFEASGDPARARRYRQDAAGLQHSIPAQFFHAAQNPDEGWLHSATGIGNQPDVWGSAFAVWSGAVRGGTARKVARALVRAFRDGTAVSRGCVRQILTTDPLNHGAWEKSFAPAGEYQNGGYWGTATGWYIAALATVDRPAAADMARDYIAFLKRNMRPDGMTQSWEWCSADGAKNANPLYVATVALPYVCMKRAGLLGQLR